MTPGEMYDFLTKRTDPSDPDVAADIRRGARHEYGLTDVHDHLPRLRAVAHGNVLEIGVRFGASTAALLAGVTEHGGHVYSVDVERCAVFEGDPSWTFWLANSAREAQHLKSLLPKELELLFVDGDHSYEGTLADLQNFGPMSRMIMCHDTNEHENPQVRRAVVDYLNGKGCRHAKAEFYVESHGLAVLS